MNHEIRLADVFGTFLAEGARAASFRLQQIEPFFHTYATIVLDFTDVRNVNSSFANALIVPLIEMHGEEAFVKLRFKNCSPLVRVMVQSALSLGVQEARKHGVRVTA
jgi:hypothetical protein